MSSKIKANNKLSKSINNTKNTRENELVGIELLSLRSDANGTRKESKKGIDDKSETDRIAVFIVLMFISVHSESQR